jgi:hypothetical protein
MLGSCIVDVLGVVCQYPVSVYPVYDCFDGAAFIV